MKNIFKSKRNILIMMFALVVIMGIGFAAYSQQLRINDTSSIDSNWNVYIKEVSVPSKTSGATGSGTVDEVEKLKAELTTDLKYPGDYVIYNITVANDGTIDAILEKINFSMEKEDTVINYYYSVDDQTTWNKVTKNGENPYNEDLLANTTDEFQVKVEYDPTKTGTATNDQKSNTLTLNLDYAQKTGGAVVPSKPITIDELKESAVTEGTGLYADEYESGRYIYRGSDPENYISFDETNDGSAGWRIISIENDNTLKIMKQESIGSLPFDPGSMTAIEGITENGSLVGTRWSSNTSDYCYYKYDTKYYGCNVWGSKTTMLDENGNNISKMKKQVNKEDTYNLPDKEAYINTYLNENYYSVISEESKKYIDNHVFYVGNVHRVSQLEGGRSQLLEDEIDQEKKYKWKGNIGLINVTDYLRATTNAECVNVYEGINSASKVCGKENFLRNSAYHYYTINPNSSSAAINEPWTINQSGNLGLGSAPATHETYPVLYLKPDITLSGTGTQDDPYTINS